MNETIISESEQKLRLHYDLAMRFVFNVVKKHMEEHMLFKKRKFNIKDLIDEDHQEHVNDPESYIDLIDAIIDPASDLTYVKNDGQDNKEEWYMYYHEGVHNVEESYGLNLYNEEEMYDVEEMIYRYQTQNNEKRPEISFLERIISEVKARGRKHVASGYLVRDKRLLLIYYKKLKNWAPIGKHFTWLIESENPDDVAKENLKNAFFDLTKINVNILELNIFQALCSAFRIEMNVNLENVMNGPVISYRDNYFAKYKKRDEIIAVYFCTQNGNSNIRMDKRRILDYHWFSYDELDDQKIHKNIRDTGRLAIKVAENY